MRKTSQDGGGDTTSITSSLENEIKKPGGKTKKTSIKRKVHNFGNESDEAVKEPLLQEETSDPTTKNAKYVLSKTKTDLNSDDKSNNDNIISVNAKQIVPTRGTQGIQDNTITPAQNTKENNSPKYLIDTTAPLRNHMNTNVFSDSNAFKELITPKTHILVEIDGTKQSGYVPTPLIFTTAKIHTDGKTQQMEPVQVTPIPILSTTELKGKSNDISQEKSPKDQSNKISTITTSSGVLPTSIGFESLSDIKIETLKSNVKDSLKKAFDNPPDLTDTKQTTTGKDKSRRVNTDVAAIRDTETIPSTVRDTFKDECSSKTSQSTAINLTTASTSNKSDTLKDTSNKCDKTINTLKNEVTPKSNITTDVNKNIQSVPKTPYISDQPQTSYLNTKIDTAIDKPVQLPTDDKAKDSTELKNKMTDKSDLSIGAISCLNDIPNNTMVSKSKTSNGSVVTAHKPFILSTTSKLNNAPSIATVTKLSDTSTESAKVSAKFDLNGKNKSSNETEHSIVVPTSQPGTVVTEISKKETYPVTSTTTKPMTKTVLSKPPNTNNVSPKAITVSAAKNSTTSTNISIKPPTTVSNPAMKNVSNITAVTIDPIKPSTANNKSTNVKLQKTTSTTMKPAVTTKPITTSSTTKGVKSTAPSSVMSTTSVKQSTGKPSTTKLTHAASTEKEKSPNSSTGVISKTTKASTSKVSSIPITTKVSGTSNTTTVSSGTSVKPSTQSKKSGQK